MKRIIHSIKLSLSLKFVCLLAVSVLFQACGGSKESASSAPVVSDVPAPSDAPAKEPMPASAEPTMENMKTALVDAISTISTDTVAEITNLAKEDKAIPIPTSMEKVQDALEAAGKSDLFQGFKSSLNTTAVSALSGYKSSLADTVSNLSIPNVENIIQGGDDSLTRYVESTANSTLKDNLIPFVKDALKDTQAEGWIEKIKGAIPEETGGLLGQVSAAAGISLPTDLNLESYLTDELMGKFFDIMANQEKLFRQNPKGRSAELFKKVMEAGQQ
jgi:hypothetical protein